MDNTIKHLKNRVKITKTYQNYSTKKYYGNLRHISEEKLNKRICYYDNDKATQIESMMSMIKIEINPEAIFQCWIDKGLYTYKLFNMTDNIPPNYDTVINNSINDLIDKYRAYENNTVANNNIIILKGVCKYINRIVSALEYAKKSTNKYEKQLNNSIRIFTNMITEPANSLEDAFQRIIFWSSLFWQSNHRLVGLGRLDKLLGHLSAKMGDPEKYNLIKEFYNTIHKDYQFKSNRVSLGDTGQIIVLGGKEQDGTYFCNDLTYAFINVLLDIKLPDPKILLRVSDNMPDDLLKLALKCISTGIGCPLLSNDDVIIPALEGFGYSLEDACNYVTSACWEPLAYGKSLEKNNIYDINFAAALIETYKDEAFNGNIKYIDLINLYKSKLKNEINFKLNLLNSIQWEKDPLMSLFTYGCLEKGKDISEGGAIYNDYGFLSVGMSNAVNSLLNIKHLIYSDNPVMTMEEIKGAGINNYENEKLNKILSTTRYFGRDDSEIIELTSEIMDYASKSIENYRNIFGGKVKFGLSSSNYMEIGKHTAATLDGRKMNEPLGVHISNPNGVSFTELVNFASKLDYFGNKSNGNVVDFFVNPDMFNDEFDKFVLFIKRAIVAGFFQMQMNVVSSDTLIEARNNPDKYPDLIVRVWGFSAYFNDLPKEYKELLIKRAISSEEKVSHG